MIQRFLLLFTFSIPVFSNCELSWVSRNSNEQNWMHTESTYSNRPDKIIAKFIDKGNGNFHIRCSQKLGVDWRFTPPCSDFKKIVKNNKVVCKKSFQNISKIKKIDPAHDTVTEYLVIKQCDDYKIKNDQIVIFDTTNKSLVIPKVHKLDKVKSINNFKSYIDDKNLKSVILSEYEKFLSVDMRKVLENPFQVLFSKELKDIEVSESILKIPIKEIPTACEQGCKNPNKILELPVIYWKRSKWELFATPRIGNCSAYSEIYYDKKDYKNKTELKLLRNFGKFTNYTAIDIDHDGKTDILGFSPRDHLPGTVQFYDIRNKNFKIMEEICFGDQELCNSPAGC
jgi:hypothetical protein